MGLRDAANTIVGIMKNKVTAGRVASRRPESIRCHALPLV